MQTKHLDNNIQFLARGGDLGKVIREKDWGETSLGPLQFWQQSLRTTLCIVLNSKFPMLLFWGEGLICFYNDAYRPSLADNGKHLFILGMKGEQACTETWHIIKPLIDKVFANGETICGEDLIYRNEKNEDVYWTSTYSPVTDESGKVAGVLVSYSETTKKITATKNLKQSEDHFRLLIDNIPNLAWIAEADGWIYWYNKKWYEYTGTTQEQMEGWGWQTVHDPLELPRVMIKWKNALAEGQPFEMVFPLKGADGQYRQFLTRVLPLKNEAGEIYHWFGSNTDVTEHKKIEQALQESNTRFINNIKLAPVAMSVFKGEKHVVEIANALMLELWGKTEGQVLGKPIFEGLPESKDQGLELIIDSVFNTGNKFEAYERPVNLPRNGTLETKYVNFAYEPLREHDGSISGIIAVATEVTWQVLARIKIEESQAKFRNLIIQLPIATVVLKGPEHIIEIANSAMLKRWNKTEQELTNKRLVDAFPEIRDQKFPVLLDQVYRTGKVYRETEVVSFIQDKNEKKTFYVDFEYSPLLESDGKVSGIIATVNDVTEKVLSRKKVEESEKRYHHLIYSSPSAIGILYGPDLIITTANDAIIEIWGKGREIMGKAYFDALPELTEQGYKEVFAEVYKTGKPFNAVETPVNILQNGKMQLRYYNFLLYPQRNINGEIDGIGIIATEVTSHAVLNTQIRASEKRFRLLADSMPQHVWTSDPAGNLNYFNQSVFDYSGLSLEQINKDGWIQIVHPDDREENINQWIKSISSGKNFLFEHRFLRHDGEYRWQLSRAVPQRDENGKIQMWVGTSTDIQEQKEFTSELEKQVRTRTKELAQNNIELSRMNKELEAFAYVSSHDLQEPLRKIQTFASRISETESKNLSDKGKDSFKRMQASAARMQMLIQDLLTYSRTNTEDRKYEKTDLNKIIDEVKEELKEELEEKKATIESTGLCKINIIPFQFRQLLHNMISNSLKFSIPAKPPHINISSKIALGADLEANLLLKNTKYCHIRISDNGIGFDQQYRNKIFELFQRLNEKSQYAGTGIGLAIVKKIVENHKGVINANSALGKGATFDIYIPTS